MTIIWIYQQPIIKYFQRFSNSPICITYNAHKDIFSKKAITSSVTSIASTNCIELTAMRVMGSPVNPDTTNKFSPSGGVMKPMTRLVTMKIQKWILCIPMLLASGSNNGDRIRMFGVVSIIQPAIRKKIT